MATKPIALAGLAMGLAAVLSACGASSTTVRDPFVAAGGVESGPGSGLWGDGSSGPDGMHVGCINGRRLAVLITVHNRTKGVVWLLGADESPQLAGVIERVAVQVSLAPPPPKGDVVVSGLVPWNRSGSPPVAIPAGRDGWVQSNFLMDSCALLRGRAPVTANRSVTLKYSADGAKGMQVVSVAGARIILKQGPLHPSLPINQVG